MCKRGARKEICAARVSSKLKLALRVDPRSVPLNRSEIGGPTGSDGGQPLGARLRKFEGPEPPFPKCLKLVLKLVRFSTLDCEIRNVPTSNSSPSVFASAEQTMSLEQSISVTSASRSSLKQLQKHQQNPFTTAPPQSCQVLSKMGSVHGNASSKEHLQHRTMSLNKYNLVQLSWFPVRDFFFVIHTPRWSIWTEELRHTGAVRGE